MLSTLHVKNFALIDEMFVDFSDGLNILTGETGAGKSIILGSLNLAFGGKADKDSIREGSDFALVEITFQIDNEYEKELLKELEVYPEDGEVLIQRKILPGKSVFRINGETVNASFVKEVTNILIDVYGQHDYQFLLKPYKHIEIIDSYASKELLPAMEEYSKEYERYAELKKILDSPEADEAMVEREISLLKYQINEIDAAALKNGEEEEISATLKVMENYEKIEEVLSFVNDSLYEKEASASELIDASLREIVSVSSYDERLSAASDSLNDISGLMYDLSRIISDYMEDSKLNPEELAKLRERYELINDLERKYGRTIEEVNSFALQKKDELEKIMLLSNKKEEIISEFETVKKHLEKLSQNVHNIRKKYAEGFEIELMKNLSDLNFNRCEFKVKIEESEEFLRNGTDKIEFLISTNPGENLRPLSNVASGGELSRIMLSIKTTCASKNDNETFIFDEIDSGISGVTAWKVAEKLAMLSKSHQVILITHLQQIASMADTHFEIRKVVGEDERTHTRIEKLDADGQIKELVRMLGGDDYNEAFVNNAEELKKRANDYKDGLKDQK